MRSALDNILMAMDADESCGSQDFEGIGAYDLYLNVTNEQLKETAATINEEAPQYDVPVYSYILRLDHDGSSEAEAYTTEAEARAAFAEYLDAVTAHEEGDYNDSVESLFIG